jgi:hypothetical protein
MGLTGIVFTLAFAACLALALMRHPRFGMFAYLAAFYIHPPSRWWGAALPNMRWALLAAAVTLIAVWRMPKTPGQASWASTTPGKLMIFFTLWIWIQSFWAMDGQQHSELAVLYTKYLVLFYLIYRICSTPKEVEYFLLAHVAGCFYLGVLAFGAETSGRLEGVGGPGIDEANALGMQLATAVMCGSMIVLVDRTWRLFFIVIAMAFIFNGMVLTGSRGSFLSVVCGGIILVFMKPKEHKRLFWSLAVLAGVLFLMVANESFWQRIGTIGAAVDEDRELDTSAESRFVVAEAQVRMALRYPLGTGHRGTEVLSREYVPEKYLTTRPDGSLGARSSHNTFLSMWVEQGIPGAIVFIALAFWCRRASKQLFQRYGPEKTVMEKGMLAGISAALLVTFIAGIFVDYLKAEVTVWLLALLAAMYSREFAASAPVPVTATKLGATTKAHV